MSFPSEQKFQIKFEISILVLQPEAKPAVQVHQHRTGKPQD